MEINKTTTKQIQKASSRYRSYIVNLSAYFGASLIPMLLSLAINPLIAKNMSPSDYAIVGYYTSFSTLIGPIIVFYLIHYYVKEYFNRNDKERELLVSVISKALIWFSGLVSIVCFIALLIYLKYIKSDSNLPISPYLALSVFALPLTGLLNLKLAQYRMEKRAQSYFIISVGNGILNVALAVLLVVVLKWGAYGKLLSILLCNIGIFILMIFKLKKVLLAKTKISDFRPIFIFCLPLATSAMLGYFTHGFATTYLESVGDITEYGIYVVGYTIGSYLTVFQTAISSTFQPDLYESITKKQRTRFIKTCILQIVLVAGVVLLFVLLAPYVISILTAGRYTSSTPYAQIISISTLTSAVYYIVNNYTIAINRPKIYLYTTIIGSICIIITMPLAVQKYSFIGGAWVMVFSYIGFTIINLLFLMLKRDSCIYEV